MVICKQIERNYLLVADLLFHKMVNGIFHNEGVKTIDRSSQTFT